MKWLITTVSVAFALALLAGPASADPVSSCASDAAGGQICNIYETDASGNPTDISSVTSTEFFQTTGYVVLLDNTNNNTNPANWSDLAVFTATSIQLFSDGTWSSSQASAALAAINTQYILEAATAPTLYSPDSADLYYFYSPGSPVTSGGVPEPSSLLLSALGLAAFALKKTCS